MFVLQKKFSGRISSHQIVNYLGLLIHSYLNWKFPASSWHLTGTTLPVLGQFGVVWCYEREKFRLTDYALIHLAHFIAQTFRPNKVFKFSLYHNVYHRCYRYLRHVEIHHQSIH